MKGININDKEIPFTDLILDRIKTIETRETNSLGSLVGQRVGIIRTGCGKATLVGFISITNVIIYDSKEKFRLDYKRHLVRENSRYDIKWKKYGYILENPTRCDPVAVNSKGIVIRNI